MSDKYKSYSITLKMADGTSHKFPIAVPVGEKGEKGDQGLKGDRGEKGDQGERGMDGAEGKDGNSIELIAKTDTNGLIDTYTITLTDGSKIKFFVTNGKDGAKGDKGDTGETGARGIQGEKGDQGVQGIRGEQGLQGVKGDKGDKGDKGEGFSISKTYASISDMNANFATDGVPTNGFVLISTGNVNDEDNAKLFVKLASGYSYLTDLSGSQGIQGEKGEKGDKGERGLQGVQGEKGDSYVLTSADKDDIASQVVSMLPIYDGEVVSL